MYFQLFTLKNINTGGGAIAGINYSIVLAASYLITVEQPEVPVQRLFY
jgi:hypothetical protein